MKLFIRKLQKLLFKYKHAIIILYIPIYLTWFLYLERRDSVKYTDIHCFIDDYIPFCEVFIIPYLIWFLYVAVTLVFLFFHEASGRVDEKRQDYGKVSRINKGIQG